MKKPIHTDLELQVMACCFCKEQHEIPRRLMRDQDGLLAMKDYLAEDHRECAAHPDNPEIARLSREFRKRIEHEERRQTERRAA